MMRASISIGRVVKDEHAIIMKKIRALSWPGQGWCEFGKQRQAISSGGPIFNHTHLFMLFSLLVCV
jgi:hypothetical protein